MLRAATDADRDAVRRWRNHPQVRAVSLQQSEIPRADHERWWASVADDPSRVLLIYVRGAEPSGVVTFFDLSAGDVTPRRAMWGYYLDNDGLQARGELLPGWIQIQREAVRYATEELGIDILEAEVLDANEAVRRMNRRNGFEEITHENRDVGGHSVLVHRIRRVRTQEA